MDCCWIQLISLGSNKLSLAAYRGFNPDIQRELNLMDINHCFCNEIVGMGNKIVIPNLRIDGKFNLPIFEKEGFSSLIAVPIMTYRIHGILGFAYRVRRKFDKDYSEVLAVIANLIGMALNKSMLQSLILGKEDDLGTGSSLPLESNIKSDVKNSTVFEPEDIMNVRPVNLAKVEEEIKSFREHNNRMKIFNKSHKTG